MDNTIKISDKKFLEIRKIDENYVENNETQLLHFADCESLKEAQEKIVKFNFKDFPKVFVVIVTLLNDFEDKTEALREAILDKFTDNRPLILQLSTVNVNSFYFKPRKDFSFKEVNLNTSDEFVKEKLETTGLTCGTLLQILDCSLLNADYSTISSYFKEVIPSKLAIKSGDELCFRLINLFEVKHAEEIEAEILFSIIKTKDFWIFLAFFDAFDKSQINNSQIERAFNAKFEDFSQNVFMAAVKYKNVEISKFFLERSANFPQIFNFQLLKEVLILIKKNEFFGLFSDIKTASFSLSAEEEEIKNNLFLKVEKIFDEISKLHEIIWPGNFKKVKEYVEKFVQNFPHFRLCYGRSKVCALEHSIDCKSFNIYSYLLSQGFYSDKNDELNAKIQRLSRKDKNKIRDENLKYVVKNSESFVGLMLSKCSFAAGSPVNTTDVWEMLSKFNKIDEIDSMFPTLSYADIKVIFDYGNESVMSMDPTMNEFTPGLSYFKRGLVYVGKNANLNQRSSIFAHELTHMVYFLIYENKCLPYCKGDTEREREWIKIVDNLKIYCKNNPEITDNIVKWVFDYYEEGYEQRAEAAVRVNDMLAFHHNDPARIQALILQHPDLFRFYRQRVVPDLKIQNLYRMIKLNNDLGLIEKINESELQVNHPESPDILSLASDDSKKILLVTNAPQLMLSKILQEIKNLPGNKLNLKAKNVFVDPFHLNQKHIQEELNVLLETTSIDRIIVDCRGTNKENLNLFFDLTQDVYFIVEKDDELVSKLEQKNDFQSFERNFEWSFLTDETHEFLLNKEIKFQSKILKLKEILKDAENSISQEVLAILCSNNEINVNTQKMTVLETFFPTILKKNIKTQSLQSEHVYEDVSFENFLLETQNKDDFPAFVVVSGEEGSGKRTLLAKTFETFKEQFQEVFTCFVSCKDVVDEISDDFGDNFVAFIEKILKFNKLERLIFMQKYETGEVKILFDGLDKLSRNCREKFLKLFEPNGRNQIFITTLTNLEHVLEAELNVSAYRLKNHTKEEQSQSLDKKPENLDENNLYNITQEMSSRSVNQQIIQEVIKVFKYETDKSSLPGIEKLEFLDLFDNLVKKSLQVLCSQGSQNEHEFRSLQNHHQFLAVSSFCDDTSSLGIHEVNEWSRDQIERCGLLKFNTHNKPQFYLKSIADFFIADYLFDLITKNDKKLTEVQLQFLFTGTKKEYVQIFLNLMLKKGKIIKFADYEAHKEFQNCKTLVEFLKMVASKGHCFLFNFYACLLNKNIEECCKNIKFVEFIENVLTHNDFDVFQRNIDSMENLSPELKKCLSIGIENDENCSKILQVTVEKKLFEFLIEILQIKQEINAESCKNMILNFDKNSKKNILMAIVENRINWKKIEKILNFMNQLFRDNFSSLMDQDINGDNLFHFCMKFTPRFFEFNLLTKISSFIGNEAVFQHLFEVKNNGELCVISHAIKNHKNFTVTPILNSLNKISEEEALKAWTSLIECSFYEENNEVYKLLNTYDFNFTSKYTVLKTVHLKQFDDVFKEIETLHQNITNHKNQEIKDFVEKNPRLKYCFDSEEVSALEKCFNVKNMEALDFLLKSNFKTFNSSIYKKIDLYHQQNAKRDENCHILKLKLKCLLYAHNSQEDFQKVYKSFDLLNLDGRIKNIMKSIAYTRKELNIFFDLKNEDLLDMIPSLKDYGTSGLWKLSNNEHRLFIAKDQTEKHRNGTIAHEMTHCALHIAYKNHCLPYEKLDNSRKAKWQEIVKVTKEMYERTLSVRTFQEDPYEMEQIIFNVFRCYEEKHFEVELAVRVIHILAQYQNNEPKINALKLKHPALFKFHDDYIEKDLKIENGTELRELNDELGFLKELQDNEEDFHTNDKILPLLNASDKIVIVTKLQSIVAKKIYEELKVLEPNPTRLRTENIFINLDDEKLYAKENEKIKHILNIFDIVKKTQSVKRVIIKTSKENEFCSDILKNLGSGVKVYIIALNKFQMNIQSVDKNYAYNDFTEDSKIKLKNLSISMNGIKSSLESLIIDDKLEEKETLFYQFLTHEVISNLIETKNLTFNMSNFEETTNIYISREFNRKGKKGKISIDDEETLIEITENQNIILISDLVGSGKTETLKEIARQLKVKYPKYWISFVTLKDHKEDFNDLSNKEDYKKFMSETILKLNTPENYLEKSIFEYLFENKRVIFLLDAFDEIASYCDTDALKTFINFISKSNCKTFVTTRGHLEDKLEENFTIFAYKITLFTEEQQVKCLLNMWQDGKTREDEDFAKNLLKNLSEHLRDKDFFGVPLQIYLLSQIFYEKSTRSDSKQKFTLVEFFSKFFDAKYKIWIKLLLEKSDLTEEYEKLMNFNKIHEFVAISTLFAYKRKKIFGMKHNEIEWSLDNIQKCGIITFNSENKLFFNHQSFAEFSIARFIFTFLVNFSEATNEFSELLFSVLSDDRFQPVRIFLSYMLATLDLSEEEFKEIADKFTLEVQTHERKFAKILSNAAKDDLFNLYDFELKICREFGDEIRQKIKSFVDEKQFPAFTQVEEEKMVETKELFVQIFKF